MLGEECYRLYIVELKELRSIQEASSMSLLSQWITGLDLQSSK